MSSRRRSNRGQTDCDESERGSNKPIRDARREQILNEHSSNSCVPLLLPNSNDPPQDVKYISPRHHRKHVGTTRNSPFTPASSTPHLLPQDILSRSLTLSDTPPSKVDFANQQIAIAKEVGQTLCNDALADLHSSFSSVLSNSLKEDLTSPDVIWPSGDPLLSLKSTTQAAASSNKQHDEQRASGDVLKRRLFNDNAEQIYGHPPSPYLGGGISQFNVTLE